MEWWCTSSASVLKRLSDETYSWRRKRFFSNAECVVPAGHEIIERDKQVGVILAGSSQQVLFRVPASRFCQTLTLKVWSLESFFQVTAGGGREAFLRFTPHQFQAYLQHFHLLSFPSRLETLLLFKSDVSRNVTPLHVSNKRRKKIKHEKKTLTKSNRAPIQNGC